MSWTDVQTTLNGDEAAQIIDEASRSLSAVPFKVLRNRKQINQHADQAVRDALRRLNAPTPDANQLQAILAGVVARVGGLGFLDGLLPPASNRFTDILVNGDGSIWGRAKGAMQFEQLDLHPDIEEVWRATESLLAPQDRACTEATPTVDAKLPRNREIGFGGARIKVLHPAIASGDGFPVLAIRLFEPKPVPPSQMVEWGVFPQAVMDTLLDAAANRLRIMVIGGTSTGKTTLLSALCHGIPESSRVVKVEDPEEIWLPHPNVTTVEARPAPPGSDVPAYTVSDGVDDAMRLAPTHLIVGEVRTGTAALSLFRALMSDHAGLTTFHAERPDEAVFRLGVIMFADEQVRFDAARGLFAQAIDLVVHVGWREGQRKALGVWEVSEQSGSKIKFNTLWDPNMDEMKPITRQRN